MAKKKKVLPEYENVSISDVAAEGKSIARIDDMVVFVPYGAPGDIVNIKLDKKKKNYGEGHITKIINPSDLRVKPFCQHFGICGGCKWQHLPYSYQLKCKQQQVVDALQRIAKVELPAINDILGSIRTERYRNKLEFTFSNKCWLTFEQMNSGEVYEDRRALGFHIPGAFDKVLDIKECHLQDEISDRIRLFIRDFAISNNYEFYDIRQQKGFLRNIVIRTASTEEVMLIVVFKEYDKNRIEALLDAIKNEFSEITSLMYVVNGKVNDTISDQDVILYSGRDYIIEQMGDLKFRVGPKSFYQTNSLQAFELYKVAHRMARLSGNELVYDLYTGTGTIANFVARDAREVIGIEYVEDAIADAKINSQANGITNTAFFAGDMKDVLTREFVAEHGTPDVMIIDPPRAGMHQDVVDVILDAEPSRIVYVSCNPATQARDIALLDCKYKVEEVQPVDMFPHTQHVENVVALNRKLYHYFS